MTIIYECLNGYCQARILSKHYFNDNDGECPSCSKIGRLVENPIYQYDHDAIPHDWLLMAGFCRRCGDPVICNRSTHIWKHSWEGKNVTDSPTGQRE